MKHGVACVSGQQASVAAEPKCFRSACRCSSSWAVSVDNKCSVTVVYSVGLVSSSLWQEWIRAISSVLT